MLLSLVALASPSPSPTPLAVIATVRVATGAPQTLHRLPVAASLADVAAIESAGAMSGDALLRLLPGVDRTRSNSAFTNYGQSRVSFNGAGNDRGLVLADGVPAQDAFGGQIDWAAYPADDIVRAELLRGAGSALYGAGAVGGVLQITTFGPLSPHAGSAAATLANGTHETVRNYGGIALPFGRAVVATLAVSQQQQAYADLPPGYATAGNRQAQSASTMISLRARYAATASTAFEYGYRGAWDDQQEGRPNYDFSRRLNQHSLQMERSGSRASLRVQTYIREAFVTNRSDTYPSAPGVLRYTQYVPTNESGTSVDWILGGARSQFTVRADARAAGGVSSQYGADGVLQAVGTGSQRLDGLALQQTLASSRISIVAGLREDVVSTSSLQSRTDRAISPRVALRCDIDPHLAFRISEGAGFRAPFLNELVRGYQIGPVSYLPNPSLVPERSSSLAVGLDWSSNRTHVALDATHTFVNDAIGFITVSATSQMRGNVAHTRTDGETLTVTRAVSPATRLTAFGTAQYARVAGGPATTVGKRLPYVPAASAGISVDSLLHGARIGASLTYAGQTYADDLNTQPLGTTLLLGAHYALALRSGALVVLDIENATNARYLSSIDRYGPPATVTLGVRIPVTGSR
ncbi:MAG: TonB-dependent receptor [Candidatus Eremiobacteraeota bacterium]|nr:TonB-dependent receptor [Candidatus Eremiobacteraeota bacterium]